MRAAASTGYAYGARPVRNPFRYALALWRLVRVRERFAIDRREIVGEGVRAAA